jgi:hypothetical protein
MNPRPLLALFMLLTVQSLAAQNTGFMSPSGDSLRFSGFTQILTGSNLITNQMWQQFHKGGYIDKLSLQLIDNSLQKTNLVGGQISAGVSALFPFSPAASSDSVFGLAGFSYHYVEEVSFSKPLAQIVLHGNLPFEGENVPLAPFEYRLLHYQQILFGICKISRTHRGAFFAGFTGGIALGMKHMEINLSDGSLFTAPFGEYINLYTRMDFMRSAPETMKPLSYQGAGPVLNFFYRWTLGSGTSFSFSLEQLGFIRWNNRSYSYSRDTTFSFEGIVADNIFQMGQGWEKSITPDTLDYWFNLYGEPHRHFSSLPASIRLAGLHRFKSSPFSLEGQFLWQPNTLMKPYGMLGLEWQITPSVAISRNYAIGGYSRFSSGIGMKLKIRRDWYLSLSTNALIPAFENSSLWQRQFSGSLTYAPGKSTRSSSLL